MKWYDLDTRRKTGAARNGAGIWVAPILKASFDGDALNLMAVLDMRIWEDVRRLEPHTGALDLNRVWKLSGDMGLPLPVRSTINEYLRGV